MRLCAGAGGCFRGAPEGPCLRGSGGPPHFFLEFRRQILHSGRLYEIIHRNFFSPVLDVPRGPTFWEVGTAMAVPAVPVAPALNCVRQHDPQITQKLTHMRMGLYVRHYGNEQESSILVCQYSRYMIVF